MVNQNEMKEFKKEVVLKMIDLGLTQTVLAPAVGVSQAYLSDVINGKRKAEHIRDRIMDVLDEFEKSLLDDIAEFDVIMEEPTHADELREFKKQGVNNSSEFYDFAELDPIDKISLDALFKPTQNATQDFGDNPFS